MREKLEKIIYANNVRFEKLLYGRNLEIIIIVYYILQCDLHIYIYISVITKVKIITKSFFFDKLK